MEPLEIYGVKLKDKEKQLASQSGGAFTAIAEYILSLGGVVYGCGFDYDFQVVYLRVDNVSDLYKLKGSKYVQAKISGSTYDDLLSDLSNGRTVLFSGTACYCEAVRKYIEFKKVKGQLITVDLICHGVPSPKIYRDYISYLEKEKESTVIDFSFRYKQPGGWHVHEERIKYANGDSEIRKEYTTIFYTNIILRPSCGKCQYASLDRKSDFTIGDFWGIEKKYPEHHDKDGMSVILLNSNFAIEIFDKCKNNLDYFQVEAKDIIQPNLLHSTRIPLRHVFFWYDYKRKGIEYCFKKYWPKKSLIVNIKGLVKKILGG